MTVHFVVLILLPYSEARSKHTCTNSLTYRVSLSHSFPTIDIVMMEEAPTTPTLTPTPTPAPSTPTLATSSMTQPPPLPSASPSTSTLPGKDTRRTGSAATPGGGAGLATVGLTKEVLSTHTQQEEKAFLNRFKGLSELLVPQPKPSPPPAGKGTISCMYLVTRCS